MAKIIPIKQNPNRYSEQTDNWVISASPNILPVTIQKGIPLDGLKPLLSVDGIIVKADNWYLCSQGTLDSLKQSSNPHYSIESNGPIKVKGKNVVIGKTVRVIEISIDKLRGIAGELDIKNRKAGVSFVDYIFEGQQKDGVPLSLIKQIDYTLSQEAQRPEDEFGVYQLDLGDTQTVYNIEPLNQDTRQPDGSLDKGKLEKFLTELGLRLQRLRTDFNMVKEVFYNGAPPASVTDLRVSEQAKTISTEEDFPVLYKYTQLVSVGTPQTPSTGSAGGPVVESPAPTTGQPATTTPTVVRLKMRKRRDLRSNTIPVWTNDPTVGDKGPRKRIIREGEEFWGYFLKDWEHGQKIWVVYDSTGKTLFGYGVADKNDFVDPV